MRLRSAEGLPIGLQLQGNYFDEAKILDVAHRFQQATDWHRKVRARRESAAPRADMSWEVVIGLETHAQLSTASKIFSGASTAFGAAPNTQASAVDIALPGRPAGAEQGRGRARDPLRPCRRAARSTPRSVFARKNYFYPDLPKGYQISQYEIPVVQGGSITIADRRTARRRVRLTRAHLEEDAGKSLHEDLHGMSGIDLNRAGTPLLEIVSEPDMSSSDEAVAYAKALHALVRWIGICDGNMQEGSFRCDANVSVRRPGAPLGTRCEIKNLNSFRFMQHAIDFEVRRQVALIEDGGERRAGDATLRSRSRRNALDAQQGRRARLPLLPRSGPAAAGDRRRLDRTRFKAELPELPEAMKARFESAYGLGAYDATMLTQSREAGAYFEGAVRAFGGEPKTVANWMLGEMAARLNKDEIDIVAAPVKPQDLAGLLKRVEDGTISGKDREGRVRRDVGRRSKRGRCGRRDHREEGAAADLRRRARSRRSSSDVSPPIRRSSPNSAPARRRRSTRSSAR